MFSLTPTSTPADTSAVFALMALIADPVAAQKRLEDIETARQGAIDAVQQARDLTAELDEKRSAAASDLAEAGRIRDETTATADANSKRFADQQAALAEAKDAADARETELAQRETSVAARETEAKAREDQLFAREVDTKKAWDAAQALKDQYETKLNALKSALSTAD